MSDGGCPYNMDVLIQFAGLIKLYELFLRCLYNTMGVLAFTFYV